ncbi:MAG: TonB-dependent receptor [Saprospiraceae bacterium]|jgi:iron complex outermembrane receptor protein|nr:TonB-dependent receptor [Saprospiraceae bacterium]
MIAGNVRLMGVCWLACTSIVPLLAQDCHLALRGKIMDADTREPLGYASVVIEGAGRGAVADANGVFAIANLCEGTTYTVTVRHVECDHQTQIIRLVENTALEFFLHHHVLQEVQVVEKAVAPAPAQAAVASAGSELAAAQGVNLGEALKRLPGVSVLNTGATIAKPVVQGLHSNRIALVANNVALEGQQWGAEHAPEIDPFTAQRISVVKGASGVRYGVGAMAGAIVLEPAPLRAQEGFGGWISLGGFSNGRAGVASAAVDWKKPGGTLAVRLQGTAKRSGNLTTPDYYLENTGASELNFSALAGWKKSAWTHEIAASRFSQRIGILRAAHIGNLTDLQRAIESPAPLNNDDVFSYEIKRPYQQVQHYTGRYRAVWRLSERWKVSGQYALQFNDRQEYDVVRQSGSAADKPQLSFRLWTNTLDLALEHFPINHWEGGIGVQGIQQTNLVGRGGLIPDYNTAGGSVWVLERWRRFPYPLEFEFGARYDYRQTGATTSGSLNNVDTLVQFGSLSGTAGIVYHAHKNVSITLNTGLAWRPPHVNELFARGVHHGAGTYEEGRPDLLAEKAWNTNLTIQYQAGQTSLTLTAYRNQIANFIYLDPQRTFVLTSRGAFPAYFYAQADAVLQGIDAGMSVPIALGFSAEARASVLRGYRLARDSGETTTHHDWLPLMPADRFQYGARWTANARRETGDAGAETGETYVQIMATTALRQTRIPEQGLLKDAPPAFTLWSMEAGHTFRLGKTGRMLDVGLTIQNLGNARYREYLNFFRLFTDEPGTNVGVRAKLSF